MPAPDLTQFAKRLRKDATDAEQLLWSRLRAKRLEGVKFRRQEPFRNFILDFISFEQRLVIELDGSQHAETCHKDDMRDKVLAKEGFKVLRFWNNEIFENLDGVLETIRKHFLTLPLTPSHQGRGER